MVEKELIERLWEASKPFYLALRRASSLARARDAVFTYLDRRSRDIRAEGTALHPLEWDLVFNCIIALKNVFSEHNEEVTGVSALEILRRFARGEPVEAEVSKGFIEEFRRLLLGVENRSGMYEKLESSEFLRMEGREAARARSDDLDELAGRIKDYTDRYPSGLDAEVVEERAENRRRILDALGGAEEDWDDWRWHMRHVARNYGKLKKLVRLTDEEKEAIETASTCNVPFGVTPYYASLMSYGAKRRKRHATRVQIIPPMSYVETLIAEREDPTEGLDFMGELDTSPVDLVTRRYPTVAILKPYAACFQVCVYCQRNWEVLGTVRDDALAPRKRLDAAIDWLGEHPAVAEVLITGGDPFVMGNDRIEYILERLAASDHIERIRFGTRSAVVLPQRITDNLADLVAKYHEPPKREMMIVTHFQHSAEVTPEAFEAVQKFKRRGMNIYNQMVYIYANSRRFEAVKLRLELKRIGIEPYYTFNTKGKRETREYRVPVARLGQERREEARLLSGVCRTDMPVYNVPRFGKNNLAAWQNHHLLMILPNGRRVYEFHPWEKNISPTETYIHTDVSIYNYLERLARRGEDPADYDSIWYYF
ncbi:MAG: KamA family radical SAM protein [Candidatus Coatesbacteria bacterium]|nr:MAG: KamA family radical SAM protein [Candidatus Coatesbacteria bacterium]